MKRVDNHKYALLPCINEKMRLAGATNITLSEAAGVATLTINRARHGIRIHATLARLIYEALNTRKFSRPGSGPHRWPENHAKRRTKE